VALALADAGVVIERILESGPAPVGASALVDECAARGIPIQCQARVTSVSGSDRLEAATIAQDNVRETRPCDLLIASPAIVPD